MRIDMCMDMGVDVGAGVCVDMRMDMCMVVREGVSVDVHVYASANGRASGCLGYVPTTGALDMSLPRVPWTCPCHGCLGYVPAAGLCRAITLQGHKYVGQNYVGL